MGLGRYVSRRHASFLKYFAAIGTLYIIYSFVSRGSSHGRPNDLGGDPNNDIVERPEEPEEHPQDDEIQKAPDALDSWEVYKHVGKKDWTNYKEWDEDQKRVGPGEQGKPVKGPTDAAEKEKELALYKANGYNAYVSDMISLNRSMKDIRHPGCKHQKYLEKLPTVSVIFPFHEEHNSTLLRSVYSIINRSPPELLKEIILVDDFSEKEFLRQPLIDYWEKVGLSHIVKVIRTTKREGLIRGRQIGARAAKGDVLIFLDAHSEANYNWLPPLLEPIAEDYRTVVCPFVDVIDCDTYEIRPQDEGARGSFDWQFNYKRLPTTRKDRENPTKPFPSPVMAGGYFGISAKWFWELGGYDEGLDIWGGEQYELSFKVWQCHGRMVDAPCSRVAHIYRCKYMPFKNAGVGDFVSRNYKRVAEVWMDEYKEVLYDKRPGVRDANPGDLTKQKAVRDRLKCKPFSWFMKEIAFDQDKYYPAIEPPIAAGGELRHIQSNLCVDTQFKTNNQRFGLRKCVRDDPSGGGEQKLRWTHWHDIRPEGRQICFDVSSSMDKAPIVLFDCHGMKGNQLFKWKFESQQIYHPVSGLCLEGSGEGEELYMRRCDPSVAGQKWKWQTLDEKLLEERQRKEKDEDL